MKIITFIFLLVHGLTHFLGFAKGYHLARVEQLKQPISRGYGTAWLVTGVVFLLSLLLFSLERDWWWMPALLAVIGSQFLVIRFWQDAKFGTFANGILLFLVVVGFGQWSFGQMVRSERMDILAGQMPAPTEVQARPLSTLPPLVQRWLSYADIGTGEDIRTVHLWQEGEMRTSAGGQWMRLAAQQWFTTQPPGFIWSARVSPKSLIQLRGRDLLRDGKGKMLIKLYSLFPVVKASGPEIDQGAMVRYLSEIIWFPTAALRDYIHWETVSDNRVQATLTQGDMKISGIFEINEQGQVTGFEARRYYNREEGPTLETWVIKVDPSSYRQFGGVNIPTRAEVTWELKSGDFTWLRLEITRVEYNILP